MAGKLKLGYHLGKLSALDSSLDYVSPFGNGLLTHCRLVLIGVSSCKEAVFLLANLLRDVLAKLKYDLFFIHYVGYLVSDSAVESGPLYPEVTRLTSLINEEKSTVGNVLGGVLKIGAGSKDELKLHSSVLDALDTNVAAKRLGNLAGKLVDKGLAILTYEEERIVGHRLNAKLDSGSVVIYSSTLKLVCKAVRNEACKGELNALLTDICVRNIVSEGLLADGPLDPGYDSILAGKLNRKRIVPLALKEKLVRYVVLVHGNALDSVTVLFLKHGNEHRVEALNERLSRSILDYFIVKKVDYHFNKLLS